MMIRIGDIIINLEYVRTIYFGRAKNKIVSVTFEGDSPTALRFAVPEAGMRDGTVTKPLSDGDIKRLVNKLGTSRYVDDLLKQREEEVNDG